jgi:hypothetical protein
MILTLTPIAYRLMTDDRIWLHKLNLCRPFLRRCGGRGIEFAHESAKKYLLREFPDGNPILEQFRFDPERAYHTLAKLCLDCVRAGFKLNSEDQGIAI